jgi:hypothetical protein
MVLVRDGSTEQSEDAVAGGLNDVTVIASDGLDHDAQCRIDDRSGVLGVEVFHQLRRTLDVREQGRDGLAFAVGRRRRGGLLQRDANSRGSRACWWRRGQPGFCAQGARTLRAESGLGRILRTTLLALTLEGSRTLDAELRPLTDLQLNSSGSAPSHPHGANA